jgi:hypothetical protein
MEKWQPSPRVNRGAVRSGPAPPASTTSARHGPPLRRPQMSPPPPPTAAEAEAESVAITSSNPPVPRAPLPPRARLAPLPTPQPRSGAPRRYRTERRAARYAPADRDPPSDWARTGAA